MAPFPYDLVIPELEKYKNAEVYWVQEEHKNMGFYDFCKPRLRTASNWSRRVHYAGRDSAASAAAGSKQVRFSATRQTKLSCVLGSQDRAGQVHERRFPKGRQGSTVQISHLFYHLQSTDSFHKEKLLSLKLVCSLFSPPFLLFNNLLNNAPTCTNLPLFP